ncbi:MAG: arsenic resistance N-acetyltransferase ArsN2, partial [Pseudomonadota bacterium]
HPSISHRFITRNNNLNSRVLRRMWDTSVLIYHVPAIILSYIIISMSYYGNALSNKPNSTDNSENIIDEKLMTILSPEYTAILIGSLPLAIILFGFLLYLFLEECDEDQVFEQICADSNFFENCSNFDQRIDLIRAQCKTGQGSPIERFFVPYARATKGITPRAQNHMISDRPSPSAIASQEATFALITAAQERAALGAALSDAELPTDDLDNPAINIFALRKADELIGFVGLEGTGTDRLLRSLVVLPGARGTGGGKQLVAALEGFARDHGCARLHLLTTTAEAFFAKLGYARADRASAPSSISGSAEFTSLCPANAAYMMKALN